MIYQLNKITLFCFIVIFLFASSGCAQFKELAAMTGELFTGNKKVPISYTNPPNDLAMADANVKNLTVAKFKGDSNDLQLTEKVISEITGLKYKGKSCYTVVASEKLPIFINDTNVENKLLNLPDEKKDLLVKKVDAVLLGTVSSPNVSQRYVRRERTDYDTCLKYKKKKCTEYRKYYVKCSAKKANIEFTVKSVSVHSAKIVFSKNYMGESSQEQCPDEKARNQTDFQLRSAAIGNALMKLTKDIAPYGTAQSPRIRTSDNSKLEDSKKAYALFKKARGYIGGKRYAKACRMYQKADSLYDASPSLNFNMGICREREGDFKSAVAYYQKAEDLYEKLEDEKDEEIMARLNVARSMENNSKILAKVCD